MKTENQTPKTVEVKKRKYTRRKNRTVDVASVTQISQTIRALVKQNRRLERKLAAIRKLVE